jgi:2-amino-4-hydroxy-6-hydroxymethyldihydropteridine diphosphokinase
MRTVYLGMGTNLDDRDGWLDRGLALLEERLVSRRAVQAMNLSPRYETEAWGMAPGTPAFLNMVVAVVTDLPLPDLLRVGLDVERECGRVRDPEAEGYTNRTLDVDVLCTSKGETWEADEAAGLDLNVPHPRMMTRRFVLQPLVDLAPELLVNGRAVAEALGACPAKPEVRLHVVEPEEKR